MVNTEIRLIIFFSAEEALYSQQKTRPRAQLKKLYTVSKKQDLELTVAHNMSSLLENSGLNSRK